METRVLFFSSSDSFCWMTLHFMFWRKGIMNRSNETKIYQLWNKSVLVLATGSGFKLVNSYWIYSRHTFSPNYTTTIQINLYQTIHYGAACWEVKQCSLYFFFNNIIFQAHFCFHNTITLVDLHILIKNPKMQHLVHPYYYRGCQVFSYIKH